MRNQEEARPGDTTRWTMEMELNPLPSLGDRIMDRFGKLRLMIAIREQENGDLRELLAEAGKTAPPSRYKAGAAEAMMKDIQKMLNERQIFVDRLTAFLDKLDTDIPFESISEAETRVQPPDSIKFDDLEGPAKEQRQQTRVLPGREPPVDMTSKELGPDDLTPPSGTETDSGIETDEDRPGTEVDVLSVDSDPDLADSDADSRDLGTKSDQDESQVEPLDSDDGDKTEVDPGQESRLEQPDKLGESDSDADDPDDESRA